MLEDAKRVAESAQRMRVKMCGYSHFRLPFPLKSLQSAAGSRMTKLLFFSTGMSKREKNRTYYNYRKKYISWTIEWRFHSTDVVLLDHGIHENRSLHSVIENHLKLGPWNHQLKQFCEEPLVSLKFFIRNYPKGSRSPFRELNIMAPIREQLANLVILEYPVIHVFLPSHSYDFEVVKNAIPQREAKESVRTDDLSQTGVTFREEEIEEDGCFDPQVSDPMTDDLHAQSKSSSQKMVRDKQLIQLFDSTSLARTFHGSTSDLTVDACNRNAEVVYTEKSVVCDNAVTDVEQGLVDAYTDTIAQTTSDDFLMFDGVVPKEVGVEGSWDYANFVPIQEELEEGEIS